MPLSLLPLVRRLTYSDIRHTAGVFARTRPDRHVLGLEVGRVTVLIERPGRIEPLIPRSVSPVTVIPARGTCRLAPEGWWCSLADGHDGPCPAYPHAPALLA